MSEPTSDRGHHRAIIIAALISAGAIITAAFIQRGESLDPAVLRQSVERLWSSRTRAAKSSETKPSTDSTSDTNIADGSPPALRALTARAETGDREAQAELADVYYEGQGVTRSHSRAFYWYRQAATAGHTRAERQLGWMLTRGIGTAVDRAEAAHWFRAAADAGDARAANYLGWAYVQGWE
jgi:TPR repeat protein